MKHRVVLALMATIVLVVLPASSAPPANEPLAEEVDLAEEMDYMARADEFMMSLPVNGFYLMTTQDLINATEAEGEEIVILDVRPQEMYDAGHIPGSVNVPDPELVQNMSMVPADKKIAVVCQIDTNSAFAVSVLRIFGDRDAWVVLGGVPGWTAAGMELAMSEEVEDADGSQVSELVMLEDIIPENGLPESTIPGDIIPEDGLPESTIPGDIIPENGLPESTIPGDIIPEGGLSESTIPGDIIPQ